MQFILSHPRDNAFTSAVVRRTACGRVGRELHGWLFPFSTFCTVSRHCLHLLPVPGGWDFVFQAHPKYQRGLSGEADNPEDLRCHTAYLVTATWRLYGYTYGTAGYVGSICGRIDRVFRFSLPLSCPFRMSKPFDRAPHLSYDLHLSKEAPRGDKCSGLFGLNMPSREGPRRRHAIQPCRYDQVS